MYMNAFLLPDSVIAGKYSDYRVLSMVGRGGMGAVYRVMRVADHTVWALKEMRPTDDMRPVDDADQRRFFLQEAELLSALSHPNLPAVAEIFVHDGRPCIIMEFVSMNVFAWQTPLWQPHKSVVSVYRWPACCTICIRGRRR